MKLVKPTAFFWSCFVFTLIHVTASLLAAERPNIVIIFTDDQQYDTYGANGRSKIQTPALDQLAKRGVRFTNAHAALSLCSPSRAAVLTGRYGSANGVQKLGARLREGEVSFAQDLKRSGYTTLFSGKWHVRKFVELLNHCNVVNDEIS